MLNYDILNYVAVIEELEEHAQEEHEHAIGLEKALGVERTRPTIPCVQRAYASVLLAFNQNQ